MESNYSELVIRARQHMQTLREVAAGLGARFTIVGGDIVDDLIAAVEDLDGDRGYLDCERSAASQNAAAEKARADEMAARLSRANDTVGKLAKELSAWVAWWDADPAIDEDQRVPKQSTLTLLKGLE